MKKLIFLLLIIPSIIFSQTEIRATLKPTPNNTLDLGMYSNYWDSLFVRYAKVTTVNGYTIRQGISLSDTLKFLDNADSLRFLRYPPLQNTYSLHDSILLGVPSASNGVLRFSDGISGTTRVIPSTGTATITLPALTGTAAVQLSGGSFDTTRLPYLDKANTFIFGQTIKGVLTLGDNVDQQGSIKLFDGNGITYGQIYQGTATTNRSYTLPDSSGTIALKEFTTPYLDSLRLAFLDKDIIPATTNAYDLGSYTGNKWRYGYFNSWVYSGFNPATGGFSVNSGMENSYYADGDNGFGIYYSDAPIISYDYSAGNYYLFGRNIIANSSGTITSNLNAHNIAVGQGQNTKLTPFLVKNYAGTTVLSGDTLGRFPTIAVLTTEGLSGVPFRSKK